ncbi:MAG: tetratricopeptide repeat protein [Gammaproteobacteria bacterium]|nr:tetratricopeptide repeat protein [Gammaproteobacteria bacterium]
MTKKERSAKQPSPASGSRAMLEQAFAEAMEQYQKGNYAQAEQAFRRAATIAPTSAAVAHNLAHMIHLRGAHTEAIAAYRRALAIKPDYVEAWFNLGNALREHGDISAAIDACRRVIQLKPDFAAAWNNFATLLLTQGELAEAQKAYEKAVDLRPNDMDAYNNLACCLQRRRDYAPAEQRFLHILKIDPNHADALFNLAQLLQEQNRYVEAAEIYRRFLALRPDHADAWNNFGVSLDRIGRSTEAEAAFRRAILLQPGNSRAISNFATWLSIQERIAEAEAAYREAIRLNPDDATTYNHLGLTLAAKGDIEAAERNYRHALTLDPNLAEAYAHISMTTKFTSSEHDDVKSMERLLTSEVLDQEQTAKLCFALGKVYDDCKAYDKAFFFYDRANKLKHVSTKFDIERLRAQVERIIRTFDADFFARQRHHGCDDELPVFIVGMPRSGTTLVEQIVASHPQVHGAGELVKISEIITCLENQPGQAQRRYPEYLNEWVLDESRAAAAGYLERLRRDVKDQHHIVRVTDKMHFNFMHLGLIALLFPKARIIHCRRDPLDTCLSNYFHDFAPGVNYAYSLEEIARYYQEYERVMRHWQDVLPIKILDSQYEKVVADIDTEARRLIDYLGLEWHSACLEFYRSARTVRTLSVGQVRQPIYTQSKQRWKNYAAHIEPLIKILGPTIDDTL